MFTTEIQSGAAVYKEINTVYLDFCVFVCSFSLFFLLDKVVLNEIASFKNILNFVEV